MIKAPVTTPSNPEKTVQEHNGDHLSGLLKQWGPEVIVLAILGSVVPITLAYHYGSIHTPTSDDWAYAKSAYTLALHGHINLYYWDTISILGQLALAAPIIWIFGPHMPALDIFTSLFSVAGLLSVVYIARRCSLSRVQSLVVASLCAVCPLWILLSASFMADIPSTALILLSVALTLRAFDGDDVRGGPLVLAAIFGFLAFTIRQQMLAITAAQGVVILFLLWKDTRWRRRCLWAGGIFLVLAAAFYLYRFHIPSSGILTPPFSGLSPGSLFDVLVTHTYLVSMGLFALPVLLWAGPFRIIRKAYRTNRFLSILPFMLALPILATAVHNGPFSNDAGYFYDPPGAYLIHAQLALLDKIAQAAPAWFSWVAYAMGLAGSILLFQVALVIVGRVWQQRNKLLPLLRDQEQLPLILLNVLSLVYILISLLIAIGMLINMDRYYIMLLPVMFVDIIWLRKHILQQESERRKIALGRSLLATLAFLIVLSSGLAYATWFMSYSGAERALAQKAVSNGTVPSAASIWTNYSLNGYQFGNLPTRHAPYGMLPPNYKTLCYVVVPVNETFVNTLKSAHALKTTGQWSSVAANYLLVIVPFDFRYPAFNAYSNCSRSNASR